MPYIDLVTGQDDYVSLWYTTNSASGTVGGFDPDKPIVIMLHPIFLDSEWLYLQLQDPRLDDNFNIIAFDGRCAGRTHSRPTGKHDHWTDAADLAFAIQVRPPPIFLPSGRTYNRCPTCLLLVERFGKHIFRRCCCHLRTYGPPSPSRRIPLFASPLCTFVRSTRFAALHSVT